LTCNYCIYCNAIQLMRWPPPPTHLKCISQGKMTPNICILFIAIPQHTIINLSTALGIQYFLKLFTFASGEVPQCYDSHWLNNIVTNRPMGLTDTSVIVTTVQTKWPVIETTFTRDYSALIHSILWAHSPIYSLLLLSTDAYSIDTGLGHGTPQIHFSTRSTLCSSTVTVSLQCFVLTDLPWHDYLSLLLSAGLICCLFYVSNILCCYSQSLIHPS
jgi:hypothetical protein